MLGLNSNNNSLQEEKDVESNGQNNDNNDSHQHHHQQAAAAATVDEEESSLTTISSSSTSKNNLWTLRVMSFKNVQIQIAGTSTVRQVKQVVRTALDVNLQDEAGGEDCASSSSQLRLICKGRLLAPDDAVLTEFRVQNGDVLHAVLKRQQHQHPPAGDAASLTAAAAATTSPATSGSRRRRRNHHRHGRRPRRQYQIVGPGGRVTRASNHDDESSSSSDDDDYDEETGQPLQRLGFDRLLQPSRRHRQRRSGGSVNNNTTANSNLSTSGGGGLSRQDVAVLRTYFARQIDRFAQTPAAQNNPRYTQEPDLQRRRLLIEEDWMAAQGPTSEFRLNLNSSLLLAANRQWMEGGGAGRGQFSTSTTVGTDRDFMWGFMLGFFVGFVMLVWVWMPTVPHKQKLGILTGISFQLTLNVLHGDDMETPDEFEE